MADFDWARDTAQELIDEFGVGSTLRQPQQSASSDPEKPWRVEAGLPPLDYSVVACFLSSVGETMQYTENGQTLAGKMLGLIAAPVDAVPNVGNQIFANPSGAQVWTIKAVREHAPDAVPIMWEMVLDL